MKILLNRNHWSTITSALPVMYRKYVITSAEIIDLMIRSDKKSLYTAYDYLYYVPTMSMNALVTLTDIQDPHWNSYIYAHDAYKVPDWILKGITQGSVVNQFIIGDYKISLEAEIKSLAELQHIVDEHIKSWFETSKPLDLDKIVRAI